MKTFTFLVLIVSFSVSANIRVGMKFDDHGKLINPDDILISYAFKHDKDGFKNLAIKYLKESASYGNQNAMYFTGLLYLQQKDWSNGYAWLKLVGPDVFDIQRLRAKVESLMTEEEKSHAEILYSQLKNDYSSLAGLDKREAWRKKIAFTGSRIQGAKSFRSVDMLTPSGAWVMETRLEGMLDNYIYEYEFNPGKVSIGVLELIEEKKDNANSN